MRRTFGPAITLLALAVAAVACGDDDGPSAHPVDGVESSVEKVTSEEVDVVDLLAAEGVDTATMPPLLRELGSYEVCGADRLSHTALAPSSAAQCFLDRSLAELDAVYVVTQPTVEGDPVTDVLITGESGSVAVFHDATRDQFGSRRWSRFDASRMAAPSGGELQVVPVGSIEVALDTSLPAAVAEPAPEWFVGRTPLRWCGMDVRPEDMVVESRACLRDAIASGRPAEYATGQTGDEGERGLHWYRVLGPGRIEVIRRTLPGGSPSDTASPTWERYECAEVTFLEAPGAEVDGLPQEPALDLCTER